MNLVGRVVTEKMVFYKVINDLNEDVKTFKLE